jgi:hypothetical protein
MRRANTAEDKPETTMTRFFLAGVATLLMATSALSAQSIVVPAKYRGLWCYRNVLKVKNSTPFYRCRRANDESYQYIGRDRIKIDEENSCPISAIRPTAKGHRLIVDCPPNVPYPPKHIDLWLDIRGRLHM